MIGCSDFFVFGFMALDRKALYTWLVSANQNKPDDLINIAIHRRCTIICGKFDINVLQRLEILTRWQMFFLSFREIRAENDDPFLTMWKIR